MKTDWKMTGEIIDLSIPVIIGMISTTVLNIVDTAMVGRLGDLSLAAVGLGSFFTLIMILVFGSINVGTQAITARRLGEGRPEEFPKIAFNSVILALAIGIVTSIAGYMLSRPIFSLLSSSADVVEIGTPYLAIRFIGLFSTITMFTMRGFVFGIARVRIDMAVSIIINVLNIILNYFLIFGHWVFPRMGVSGAAVASIIASFAGLLIYAAFIRFRILGNTTGIIGRGLISPVLIGQILKISAPRAVQSLSVTGFVIFLSLIGRLGVAELAISNIIFKAFNLSFMLGMSVGSAAATLVGRSMGENDTEKAVRYGWHCAGIGSVMMGVIGALFMFFPRTIMGIFTDSTLTVEKGVIPFRILGALQLIDGIGIVLSRTLQGTGCTLYVMASEMFAIWIVMIPVTWISIEYLGGGLLMAWTSLFIYIVIFASLMAWKFHEGGWKKIRI